MSTTVSSVGPIDRAQATQIAEQALAALAPAHRFVIVPEQTLERDFGWVFFYVPQRFAQSRDPRDLVPGNGPLVVYRANGRTEYLPSAVPPQAAISELERRLAKPRN